MHLKHNVRLVCRLFFLGAQGMIAIVLLEESSKTFKVKKKVSVSFV